MSGTRPNLRSRYLVFGDAPNGILLRFEPTPDLTLGSQRRTNEVRRRVAGLLRRYRFKTSRQGEAVCTIVRQNELGNLSTLLSMIDAALDAFRQERLHPRIVEEILGITASERRRWTKDGRLPQSGSGSFRRGHQSIYFPLHPPAKIAALAQKPEVIAAWRAEDTVGVGAIHNAFAGRATG